MTHKSTSVDTLYYDGNCPICSREMSHLDKLKDKELQLLDIHKQPFSETKRRQFLNVLHVITAEGDVLTGFEANLRAWQHTRYARLLQPFSYPPLSWCGALGYAIWLRYYRWQSSSKQAL